jgi:hypothetical protein
MIEMQIASNSVRFGSIWWETRANREIEGIATAENDSCLIFGGSLYCDCDAL